MEIWTTFCPQKVSWELTCIKTEGKSPSSDWQKNIELINSSLIKLKNVGICGIRLVIYPTDLTDDGKIFNWKCIDKALSICTRNKIKVDLCIGPFQYPYYPGIYLPTKMLPSVIDNQSCIDAVPNIWKYGMRFLKAQVVKYGTDKRISGFHLGNEWPDRQNVSGNEKIKTCVSAAFMTSATEYLNTHTEKRISLNTNIDVSEKSKLSKAFKEVFDIFGNRGNLGFDIYPSQETWKKVPLQKLKRLIWTYSHSFRSVRNEFAKSDIYFAEVEAQPWGGGQSWYELINNSHAPNEKVLKYEKNSLEKTFSKYIKSNNCNRVSLWGADFWLSADLMGIIWPLNEVRKMSKDN